MKRYYRILPTPPGYKSPMGYTGFYNQYIVSLDFCGLRDQATQIFTSEDNIVIMVDFDKHTIWAIFETGEVRETINMTGTIEHYLKQGFIEECVPDKEQALAA